ITHARASGSTLFPYTTLFRSPLERVARHLADSGLAAWWLDPVDQRNQFQVEFDQHDPQGRTLAPGSNALGLLQEWRAGILATERSEEHTSELQSRENLVCRLL